VKPRLQDDDVTQYRDLQQRLTLLENRLDTQFVSSTVLGLTDPERFDAAIPDSATIVLLDFEVEYSVGAWLLLQPNASVSSIVTDYAYTSSTLAPDAITGPTVAQITTAGLFMASTVGSTGTIRAVGSARVVASNYTGRTMMDSSVSFTNSIGSSNAYIVRIQSSAAYDLSDPLTSIRVALTASGTPTFSAGNVLVRSA
jgi:hypothetical protein